MASGTWTCCSQPWRRRVRPMVVLSCIPTRSRWQPRICTIPCGVTRFLMTTSSRAWFLPWSSLTRTECPFVVKTIAWSRSLLALRQASPTKTRSPRSSGPLRSPDCGHRRCERLTRHAPLWPFSITANPNWRVASGRTQIQDCQSQGLIPFPLCRCQGTCHLRNRCRRSPSIWQCRGPGRRSRQWKRRGQSARPRAGTSAESGADVPGNDVPLHDPVAGQSTGKEARDHMQN